MGGKNRTQVPGGRHHRGYHIPELIVAWGDGSADILGQIDNWTGSLTKARERSGYLKRLSRASQQEFNPEAAKSGLRLAVTAYTECELEKKLVRMRKMIARQPEAPFAFSTAGIFYGGGAPSGRTAFLFPGQGAQYLGMGGALAEVYPAAGLIWDTLGDTRFAGKSIREVVFPEDAMDEASLKNAYLRLSGADWTNPGIAVAGESIFSLLTEMGLYPDAVAAHSFGDISAFRSAGILTAEDMLAAIRYRGELGVACPLATRGCILVVPETAEKTRSILNTNGFDDVWIANYNTPRQVVLSGIKESVHRAHQVFAAEGIDSRLIPISAAPHCPLAVDVAEKFFKYLHTLEFHPAQCEVYSFLFGRKVGNNPDLFRKLLKTHVEKPVRFLDQIRHMHQDGIRVFVEIGPADILTRMTGRILADRPHLALATDDRKGDPLLAFVNTVADLYKEGLIRNLKPLWDGYEVADGDAGPYDGGDSDSDHDADVEKRLKKLDMEFARIEQERIPARAV